MGKHRATEIETVDTGFTDMVMVCRSCGDSGFGERGHDDLRRALKHALRDSGRRREVAVVAVDCLGVCPKHAVTVGSAAQPGRLLIVPEGQAADTVLHRLGIQMKILQSDPA